MTDIIVKSKIKEAVPGLNVAGEVAEALNRKVLKMLDEASERCKANGRRTLQARDL
jgi:histone H3/H4